MDKDDDNIDFQDALSNIRPLNQDKHKPFTPGIKLRKKRPSEHDTPLPAPYEYDFNLIDQESWVSGEDPVLFKQSGLQQKIMNELRRGTYPIEARLDLHRLTAGEAMAYVDDFLSHCTCESIRCALIIHGKGSMSRNGKPIIKNILIAHLRHNSHVLAYHSARPKDGGTGALYVLIRASHKVLT